jgi:caffeoyl-CoA O-methyltransferase
MWRLALTKSDKSHIFPAWLESSAASSKIQIFFQPLRVRPEILMKAKLDAIIHLEQAQYLDNLLPPSDALLAEMEAYAAEHRVPIADREVARFLEITARAIKARRALECGMAIGYSVIHLARGMAADGLVVTIDPSDEMIKAAEGYLSRAGLRERARIEKGYALEVIPRLNETFDLIFLDAVKEEYRGYLDLGLPKLRPGGVVLCDNLLWGGQVAGEISSPDQKSSTEALREFNRYFINHPQLRAEVLAVGDGLGYGVKIS